jgi:hypothetical protein
MTHQMKSHSVIARRIVKVEPLILGDKMLAPDVGLILRLADSGKKVKWMAEPGNPAPQAGDFFVTDSELEVSFVVSASKFDSLFQAA